jgi:integrase
MRTRFEVKENKWASRKYFVDGRENGKRSRKFFKTKAEAKTYADLKNNELLNHGIAHAEFDSRLRDMAQDCAAELREFGATIADATKHYITHLKAVKRSCTVAALVDEVIAAKTKACGKKQRPASRDYIVDLNVRLGRFKKEFSERTVATITQLEIDDWLSNLTDKHGENLSPQSKGNYARALGVAFAYAVKRRYAPANPCKEIDKPTSDAKPEVLTVEQMTALLASPSPEILPCLAIGAFAGLRASEIERLDWRDIDFEENEIAVNDEGKTGERHVDMLPNLREWLLPLRRLSGKITPENFRKHFDEAREAAGVIPWPNNALRHSFGSYHLKHFHNDALTRLQMGHWRDSTVLFAHYRRAVTRRNAERYWNIRPARKANVVPMKAEAATLPDVTRAEPLQRYLRRLRGSQSPIHAPNDGRQTKRYAAIAGCDRP